ncbi:hypothetical protein DIS24_g7155 [Lasiodiplodia hormozganensis]|uniref:Uncharacterized protein n=1 Tax=Lasiodiplodia hormozganensis TaxID=869390 RepID=A0AA39YCK1_9PEZI|nr:hypothetical protein DIS24_g7155 [Lasiodiplodia hormozganensis]
MAANVEFSLSAIAALTETEKTRLIIMTLYNKDRNNMDWDAATALSGAKSKHAFQVSYYAAMKKLNNSANGGDGGGGNSSKAATPKRKRAGGGDGTPTPTPKRGRKGRKAIKSEEAPESQPDSGAEAEHATEAELELESFFDAEEI